mgnify:FL=1
MATTSVQFHDLAAAQDALRDVRSDHSDTNWYARPLSIAAAAAVSSPPLPSDVVCVSLPLPHRSNSCRSRVVYTYDDANKLSVAGTGTGDSTLLR